jgi:hypothetical protein
VKPAHAAYRGNSQGLLDLVRRASSGDLCAGTNVGRFRSGLSREGARGHVIAPFEAIPKSAERFTITGGEFDTFIHGDVAKWRKVVEFAGIQN